MRVYCTVFPLGAGLRTTKRRVKFQHWPILAHTVPQPASSFTAVPPG